MHESDTADIPPESLGGETSTGGDKESFQTRITLIQRVTDQYDEASWEDFSNIYYGYVYAIIRRMNMSAEDAEDLVQQVLLTVWKKIPETDVTQIRRFRSWLAKITRDLVINFIRKRSRDANRIKKVEADETLYHVESIPLPDIDEIAEKEWKLHLTHLALKKIEPLFSGRAIQVFRLNLDGMGIGEIAEKLNLEENSVYRLRNRVKKKLMNEIILLRDMLE